MNINKLYLTIIHNINFKVHQVTLPDTTMVQWLSRASDDYWLSATSSNNTAFFAHNDIKYGELRVKFLTALQTEVKGIRPVIYFTSSEVHSGDELLLDNYLFRVINDGIAVCETITDYSVFDISKSKNYNTLTFYQTLKKWEKPTCIYKVEKTEVFPIVNTSFTMLSSSDTKTRVIGLLTTGVPYWTKYRKDEYTGFFITPGGAKRSSDILDRKYICPVMSFFRGKSDKNFGVLSLFKYEDRVYRVINIHDKYMEALCLNPISEKTCYSTGIQEYTTLTNEVEFYKNAEVYEKIKLWREKEDDIKIYI